MTSDDVILCFYCIIQFGPRKSKPNQYHWMFVVFLFLFFSSFFSFFFFFFFFFFGGGGGFSPFFIYAMGKKSSLTEVGRAQ